MQLHRPQALKEFEAHDARMLVVSFAPLDRLKDWVPYWQKQFVENDYRKNNLDLPRSLLARTRFLADPELSVYHAYGMGRYSPLAAYGPKIVWQYLKWMIEGKPINLPHGDTLQRGGDFVVDRKGRLTLSYVGSDQSERPPVAEILRSLAGQR